MRKLPALFLVGIVGGIVGAALMWQFMRDARPAFGRRMADDPAPASTRRIGTAEVYRPAPELEPAQRGTNPRAGTAGGAQRSAKSPAADVATRGEAGDPEQQSASVPREDGAPAARPSSALARPAEGNGATDGEWRIPVAQARSIARGVEEARMAALEAATPYVNSGFAIREDHWGGMLDKSPKAITHQLFAGNEYWFWAGTDRAATGVDLHVYDSEGNLAESEHWRRPNVAGAQVTPSRTGTFYFIISQAAAKQPAATRPAHWAVVYGYR